MRAGQATFETGAGNEPLLSGGVVYADLDGESARLRRQVMVLALFMAALGLVSSVLQLLSGLLFSTGILAGVVLPVCAFFGAYRRKRWVLSCFSFTSFLVAAFFITSFVVTLSMFRGDVVGCLCSPACAAEKGLSTADAGKICENEDYYRFLWWLAMALGLAMAAMQCLSGLLASKLNRREAVAVALMRSVGGPILGGPEMAAGFYRSATVYQPAQTLGPGETRYTYASGTSGYRW
jgi:hypothetical protein